MTFMSKEGEERPTCSRKDCIRIVFSNIVADHEAAGLNQRSVIPRKENLNDTI